MKILPRAGLGLLAAVLLSASATREDRYREALQCWRSGDLQQAGALLRELQGEQPTAGAIALALGLVQQEQGQFVDALLAWQVAAGEEDAELRWRALVNLARWHWLAADREPPQLRQHLEQSRGSLLQALLLRPRQQLVQESLEALSLRMRDSSPGSDGAAAGHEPAASGQGEVAAGSGTPKNAERSGSERRITALPRGLTTESYADFLRRARLKQSDEERLYAALRRLQEDWYQERRRDWRSQRRAAPRDG
jgi:hypothetical protein